MPSFRAAKEGRARPVDTQKVPPWAMKVVLDEEEFAGPAARSASALAEAMSEEDDLYRDLNNS